MRRFTIRQMLLATFAIAVAIAVLFPFYPRLECLARQANSVDQIFSTQYNEFDVTVKNRGKLPIWCVETGDPIECASLGFAAPNSDHVQVMVNVEEYDTSRLAPGQSRTYRVLVKPEFKTFHFFVNATDWRGRISNMHPTVFPSSDGPLP